MVWGFVLGRMCAVLPLHQRALLGVAFCAAASGLLALEGGTDRRQRAGRGRQRHRRRDGGQHGHRRHGRGRACADHARSLRHLSSRRRRAGRHAADEAVDDAVSQHRARSAGGERPGGGGRRDRRPCWRRARRQHASRSAGSTRASRATTSRPTSTSPSAVGERGDDEQPAALTPLAGSCAADRRRWRRAAWTRFLASFGRRAFRRPLTADEMAALRDVAMGTSPAPQRRRGDPQRDRRAADVAALREPPRARRARRSRGASDYLRARPLRDRRRASPTPSGRPCPTTRCWPRPRTARWPPTPASTAQLDRVFADPRTRDTLWQFWNEWLRLESFTGFSSERPAFMALAAGENLGVAGHDH